MGSALGSLSSLINEMDAYSSQESAHPPTVMRKREDSKTQKSKDPQLNCAMTPAEQSTEPCQRQDDIAGKKRKASEQVASTKSSLPNECEVENPEGDVKPDSEIKIENQKGSRTISQQAPILDDEEVQFVGFTPGGKRRNWDLESWAARGMFAPLTPEERRKVQQNSLKGNGVVGGVAVQKKATGAT